jgi:hypothetical protein
MRYRSLLRGEEGFLTDLGRILTAALTALIVVIALRPLAMGFGLGLATPWDVWAFRLMSYWVTWALAYLGLTWFLIIRSDAQQTRRWALAQRTPPRPHLSVLRSVILRILQVLFLATRTSSLFFIIFISLVLAISLGPEVRDLETMRGVSLAIMAALGVLSAWGYFTAPTRSTTPTSTIDPKIRPEGLPFPASRVRSSAILPTSLLRSARALPSPTSM